MVSAQQTNLLPKNASGNDAIFAKKSISDICGHSAILKFLWLHNHHGIYIYICLATWKVKQELAKWICAGCVESAEIKSALFIVALLH